MHSEKREMLVDMAVKMAVADMATNGSYLNQPYKIAYDGEIFIARVRDREYLKETRKVVEVEQPVKSIGYKML